MDGQDKMSKDFGLKKYLVIQQKMVGDVLMSTLLCDHLKTNVSNCEVHYVVHESTRAVTEGNPNIDTLWMLTKKHRENKILFFKFLAAIRKERFEAVIDVYGKLESNLISLFARSPCKIAFKKSYTQFIYHHTLVPEHVARTDLGVVVENRLSLLTPILSALTEPKRLPKIYISPSEKKRAQTLLQEKNIDLKTPLIMVGLLGSSSSKSYPLPYLAQLLNEISERFQATFLLNYLPRQKKEVSTFLMHCSENTKQQVRADIEPKGLREFLCVLEKCQGYLGNEGGAGNMARSLGIPNFSIYAPWLARHGWYTDFENPANRVVHVQDYFPELKKVSKKQKKKTVEALYQQFNPELFTDDLLVFLEREVFAHQ